MRNMKDSDPRSITERLFLHNQKSNQLAKGNSEQYRKLALVLCVKLKSLNLEITLFLTCVRYRYLILKRNQLEAILKEDNLQYS